MTDDPYAAPARRVEQAVLDTPGALALGLRRAVAASARGEPPAGTPIPAQVAELADTVASQAYRTTDEQVEALASQLSEDGVLELTLAAAAGAARVRLDAALRALGDA